MRERSVAKAKRTHFFTSLSKRLDGCGPPRTAVARTWSVIRHSVGTLWNAVWFSRIEDVSENSGYFLTMAVYLQYDMNDDDDADEMHAQDMCTPLLSSIH